MPSWVFMRIEKNRQNKKQFDKLSEDTRLADPEDSFHINVVNVIVNTVTTQLQQRLVKMKHLAETFSVLNSDMLAQSDDQRVLQRTKALQREYEYEDDQSPEFPIQMVYFRSSIEAEIAKLHSITELAHMLIVENASVLSGFADSVKNMSTDQLIECFAEMKVRKIS